MAEARQPIRLHNEQPAASDIGDAVQVAGSADPRSAVDTAPGRPKIFFILATDEALEVNSPRHIARLHKIQRGKWNSNRCRPTLLGNPSFGRPDPVPSGVAIASAGVCAPLFGDQSVALCTQRIDLKNVCVASVVTGVDDYLEVVIQFLADIPPKFSRYDSCRVGIGTSYTKVNVVPAIEYPYFGPLGRWLAFEGLPLQEVVDGSRLLPKGIVKCAVQSRGAIDPACLSYAKLFLAPSLPLG